MRENKFAVSLWFFEKVKVVLNFLFGLKVFRVKRPNVNQHREKKIALIAKKFSLVTK